MLATLLVANAVAGWFASFGVSQVFDALGYGVLAAVVLDLIVLVPMIFVFGEVLPKDLFRVHADRWMPKFAPLLVTLRRLLCWTGIVPLVVGIGTMATQLFGRGSSTQELGERARIAALLAEGAGTQGLSETQLGFADRVFTMRGITVGQEMRAWREVISIDLAATPAERGRRFASSGVSRMPVVDGARGVIGVVAAIDHIARPLEPTASIVRATTVLEPTSPALEAIALMRRDRVQLAVVAERADRPFGIVTMKDLVEPLIGDISAW